MKSIAFIDAEIDPSTRRVVDLGAVYAGGRQFHGTSVKAFQEFVEGAAYIGGHNILMHDLPYLQEHLEMDAHFVDTLFLSPLLFPEKPYHALVKDDKLQTDMLNNPLNDAKRSMELFYDECAAFDGLPSRIKAIYAALLQETMEFSGFFSYTGYHAEMDVAAAIRLAFAGKICEHADIEEIAEMYSIELAYALAIISVEDKHSVTPPWVYKHYPEIETVMEALRYHPCQESCAYCRTSLDLTRGLQQYFGFAKFRSYEGEPLQERAAQAARNGESLLAIFPTGGGKSVTFQLPALMAGEAVRGLTVVISPLQSLMKDQVDQLSARGIVDAVAINGLLSPIERAEAVNRVQSGLASILYISPELLRSRTIEKLLISRNVVRFVIDEAHCFSAWGQDFRVDYLYIGDFINLLQKKKQSPKEIPVSCFTATAKQKVIRDICDYFEEKLGVRLQLYTTNATRTNLRYQVLYQKDDNEKYKTLRSLIEQKQCPTIVYMSRTKGTLRIAQKLTEDGISARPYNGKMDSREKIENQEAFLNGELQVIVATSAFGMGVDKKDVGLVIHYEISDSLENYVQEAGRAGRDETLQADCYVLFHESDLDKHFILLNQTRISQSDIQCVWRAIKELAQTRQMFTRSPLEIARTAGWDDNGSDIETRVKTAIAALEQAGYIERGKNVPHIYATGILVKSMAEASERIRNSRRFSKRQAENALRIIKTMITERSTLTEEDAAETRIDYIADILALSKADVLEAVNLLREEELLADSQDMTAYVKGTDTQNKSLGILTRYVKLERFLLRRLEEGSAIWSLKQINEEAAAEGIPKVTVKAIKQILYFWMITGIIQKNHYREDTILVEPICEPDVQMQEFEQRVELANMIVGVLYRSIAGRPSHRKEEMLVRFSVRELQLAYEEQPRLLGKEQVSAREVEQALLYLAKVDALQLEGGFLVLYHGMEIKRLVMDNRVKYKLDDYRQLDEYYKQKIQQIHIVGEYANMMVRDLEEAKQFVKDYFGLDYQAFLKKYFKGNRLGEINRNITPQKYNEIFGTLSPIQRTIVDEVDARYLVVAAAPGSGKTRVLVHKLASLMLLEDVKHEQLLMLTFSRSAATEFKQRVFALIGNAGAFLDAKTFHGFCFDLMGKIGNLADSDNIVRDAATMIRAGEVEQGKIAKKVVVIDEAQDMDVDSFALISAMMERNEEMHIIAVGDDDQNIYEFRGSDSKYLRQLAMQEGAVTYEMTENYRSTRRIVELANRFASHITQRFKTSPTEAVKKDAGIIRYTRHTGSNPEYSIVAALKKQELQGTTAILTFTNEEALQMVCLLQQAGIPARILLTNDGFNLYHLAEIRMFLRYVMEDSDSLTISDKLWEKSIERLKAYYGRSSCLEQVLRLLSVYNAIQRTRYKSDLRQFIEESEFSDFCHSEEGEVLVSTIHKAKGREFDCVYLLLKGVRPDTDEIRRRIYVGMTRAKQALHLHVTEADFDQYADAVILDESAYPAPTAVLLSLGHRDVYLDWFKEQGQKQRILRFQSGDALIYQKGAIYASASDDASPLVKLSKAGKGKLMTYLQKGYVVELVTVRYIVAWQKEADEPEYAVLLPDIRLRRNYEQKITNHTKGVHENETDDCRYDSGDGVDL